MRSLIRIGYQYMNVRYQHCQSKKKHGNRTLCPTLLPIQALYGFPLGTMAIASEDFQRQRMCKEARKEDTRTIKIVLKADLCPLYSDHRWPNYILHQHHLCLIKPSLAWHPSSPLQIFHLGFPTTDSCLPFAMSIAFHVHLCQCLLN